ncbi:DUF6745 domain-containing protein [Spirillospora albida]|uniref:DUF6745 domain-containing protein n=1 Tax=Spirillospora albida TaxID=58123 RepID=UPI0004BE4D5B|nr:hypothetical protein [Spirillospora albida]
MTGAAQRDAADIREEWLGRALSTAPADRPAAEAAISHLYRLIGLDPPRFHWVASPLAALETVPPGLRPRNTEKIDRLDEWPVARLLAADAERLRCDLDGAIAKRFAGLDRLFRRPIRDSLTASGDGTLKRAVQGTGGIGFRSRNRWYGLMCVSWLAYYDAVRRAAGDITGPEAGRRLGLWNAAAGAAGWWWPRRDVCTVSERPVALRTEVWGDDGQVRLHSAAGPAIRYADGWDVHAWHGTPVPSWVIDDPGVDRIAREENVEVRRCAIERIGWPAYIEEAGLRLVASAPDPGNPGAELRLYDVHRGTRALLAVNGSVERDGTRRRYGLTVPASIDDPVAAAGWTYGLSGDQYALLARRT